MYLSLLIVPPKHIYDPVKRFDRTQKLATAAMPQDKTVIQHRIETTDRLIDQLVYELYDLTEEEIKIVEESGK